MQLWQHRVRFVVAIIGIGFAIAVYAAMKEREVPVAAPAPTRVDPQAIIESSGNIVQQVRGSKQDFLVKAERQLTYQGGATKLVGVEIAVSNKGGRDYVIHAAEAQAGERQQELHLSGAVRLTSNDGFALKTDEAFFSESDGQMRAPGTFSFSRRLLVGTGTGMTYDRATDVLSVIAAADIRLTDEGGNTKTQFLAGNAVFSRPQHLLVLGDNVHVLHNEQVADAASASARLSEDDSLLQRVELRGNAEVGGGGQGLERLKAMSIDLDYGADGQSLSHVLLQGDAAVVSTGVSGRAGRDVRGNTIDLLMSEEGMLSKMTARDAVTLTLPGDGKTASRTVEARQLDADGDSGGGLSAARFDGNVVYRETPDKASARTVRSRALRVSLSEDQIDSAAFSGAVTFEEDSLTASAATVTYAPVAGSLVLSGADGGGGPRVSDEQVSVDAGRITVQIATRDMMASGAARTLLRPRQVPPVSGPRPAAQPAAGSKLPGLFEQGTAANGNADTFEYSGAGGQATYVGNATLWQGDTAVRGNRIAIDQRTGDLRVTGAARSTLKLANGSSDGRGAALTYADQSRTITYEGNMTGQAQVVGPDGDLRADRIIVVLEPASNRVDHLEASTAVTLKLDSRTATGARLTYRAADEEYVMTGSSRSAVKISEKCRETTGGTLTFYKSADRVVIDGNEAARTQSVRGQQCSESQR